MADKEVDAVVSAGHTGAKKTERENGRNGGRDDAARGEASDKQPLATIHVGAGGGEEY